MTRAEAYLRVKFHLDPSNRLATIHQRYRQDRQTGWTDRQLSDSKRSPKKKHLNNRLWSLPDY